MLAPIALFVYNRPDHLRQTLKALEQNLLASESELYIFADGVKANASEDVLKRIAEVRKVIRENWNFKNIHIKEQEANCGLANSVIKGVTELVNQYGKVIVLEDDLVTARGFLKYMNDALELYANEPKVMQVSGYQFPIKFPEGTPETFFLPLTTSWGWATWKRSWDMFDPMARGWEELKTNADLRHRFDLDGAYPYANMLQNQMENKTIDSWAIRWWWSVFKVSGYSLFPIYSTVFNIGFDSYGTHTGSNPFTEVKKEFATKINCNKELVMVNSFCYNSICSVLSGKIKNDNYKSVKELLKKKIERIMRKINTK